jgi:hypothetical protein
MALIRLEQILSNLSYDSGSNQLTVSGSNNALIVSGSVQITSTPSTTGSLTIQNIDSFGDSGSFYTVDLGDY